MPTHIFLPLCEQRCWSMSFGLKDALQRDRERISKTWVGEFDSRLTPLSSFSSSLVIRSYVISREMGVCTVIHARTSSLFLARVKPVGEDLSATHGHGVGSCNLVSRSSLA